MEMLVSWQTLLLPLPGAVALGAIALTIPFSIFRL